jgi:hypothetical protein
VSLNSRLKIYFQASLKIPFIYYIQEEVKITPQLFHRQKATMESLRLDANRTVAYAVSNHLNERQVTPLHRLRNRGGTFPRFGFHLRINCCNNIIAVPSVEARIQLPWY